MVQRRTSVAFTLSLGLLSACLEEVWRWGPSGNFLDRLMKSRRIAAAKATRQAVGEEGTGPGDTSVLEGLIQSGRAPGTTATRARLVRKTHSVAGWGSLRKRSPMSATNRLHPFMHVEQRLPMRLLLRAGSP
jgi:hypothetical protein